MPAQPGRTVTGRVDIDADGKPVVDITITDTKTGEVIDHIRIAGDRNSDAEDIARLLRRLGQGIGQRDCKEPEPPAPRPAPTPAPSQYNLVNVQPPNGRRPTAWHVQAGGIPFVEHVPDVQRHHAGQRLPGQHHVLLRAAGVLLAAGAGCTLDVNLQSTITLSKG